MTDEAVDPLVARARTAFWLIVASNAVFALTDLRLQPHPMTWVLVSKALQVAVVAVGLLLLRRCRTRRLVSALVLFVIAGVSMLVAASGAVSNDFATTVVLCVALAWGAASLLPWTAGTQAIAVLIVTFAIVSGAYWQTGDVRTAFGYPSFAVGLALALSVYVTHAFDRQRQALAAENLERTRAEAALRGARDTLERRVQERTAELERANADLHEAAGYLRESEGRFQILTELTSDYAYSVVIEPGGTIVPEWSTEAACLRITGYTPEEIIAQGGGLSLVHSEDLPIAQRRFERLLAGKSDTSEFRIVTKGGAVRWIREHGHPVRDTTSGRVVRTYNAAQDITDQKAAETALRDKADQLASVTSVMTAFLERGDWSQASAHILSAARRQTESQYGFIGVVVEGPALRIFAHEGVVWDANENREFYEQAMRAYRDVGYIELRNFDTLFGQVIRSGKALIANDVTAAPRPGGRPPGHPPLHHFLGVPVLRGTTVCGLIGVANRPGGYTGAEQGRIEILSRTLGVLYDNYRRGEHEGALEQERERATARLQATARQHQAIAELGRRALAGGALADLFEEASRLVAQAITVDECAVLELDAAATTFRVLASLSGETCRTLPVRSDAPSGRTVRLNEAVIVNDLRADPRFVLSSEMDERGLRSGMTVSIQGERRPFGVLTAYSRQPRVFTADDLHFLQAVAGVLAQSVERRRAEAEVLALNADLERRVAARTAALSEANRELEAFSYSVSHDLRSPLRSIDGFSKALIEDYGPQLEPGARELLRRVSRNAIRMGRLIDDLLKLARVGIGPLRRTEVNLSRIARHVADEHRQREPDRGADFVIAGNVVADGEETLLRVAIENLLDNAWKYTGRQARAHIEFGVEERDGEEVYFVRDNGVGFEMQHATKLFRPFERLHSTDEFDGTGVGLATVERIVRRHGGRVWADAAVGAGATFYFTLRPDQQREPG